MFLQRERHTCAGRLLTLGVALLSLTLCAAAKDTDKDNKAKEKASMAPKLIDIAPFALPNTPAGEVRFEEVRDIQQVVVEFKDQAPDSMGLSYLGKVWPETRVERRYEEEMPIRFGWINQDDWFNSEWRTATVNVAREGDRRLVLTFPGLTAEFPDAKDYDVTFRRTLGVRIDTPAPEAIRAVHVYTMSKPAHTRVRVVLDAGRNTPTQGVRLSGYNAYVKHIEADKDATCTADTVTFGAARPRSFLFDARHMTPSHFHCGDNGLITFSLDGEAFTISLKSLAEQGPIWVEHLGCFITNAKDATTFDEYRARNAEARTINQRVLEHAEQSLGEAYFGQPRPHAVSYNLGCTHARQRFWIEANGDLILMKRNVTWVEGKDTPRFKCNGDANFMFGLEKWDIIARYVDPEPALGYTVEARKRGLYAAEHAFTVPLLTSIQTGTWEGDDPMVCMVRLEFRNESDAPLAVEFPLRHSQEGGRYHSPTMSSQSPLDALTFRDGLVFSDFEGKPALRAELDTQMEVGVAGPALVLKANLAPGESREAILKVPFITIETPEEIAALHALEYARCKAECTAYWNVEGKKGAQLVTPEPQLAALHKAHFSHVQITDFAMPGQRDLVNTSVGTSTYGNFTNESCMIVHELDQRGAHDEAAKRLAVWVKYQGTEPQPGNFTDYEGMYYGAGGFEQGSYNQHHAWVLWALAEHYLITRDDAWFASIADSLIAGSDWVFRQRKNTMADLPHSRGWERGFLPAGSLEDVTDFFYWLSTNALTWRGTEFAARALEAAKHPQAARVRQEADAYRADLIKGFDTARAFAPVVRLRDGRWVPNYPSRLYCRGRETGWIRETLEGSVYLLLSGLYNATSQQGSWIVDDFQDNRYPSPPYGYLIPYFEERWFDRAGVSMQPNLLAGLVPHLDRDEPEIYIWMFYNCWSATYREEINAMVEHPHPELGYSNTAHFKTSDEANAVSWLRAMFVYSQDNPGAPSLLHLGRAIPRAWFAQPEAFEARSAATPFGPTGVRYEPAPEANRVKATAFIDSARAPEKTLLRFRLPDKQPIKAVRVNGAEHKAFDAIRGDVDLSGLKGEVAVEVEY